MKLSTKNQGLSSSSSSNSNLNQSTAYHLLSPSVRIPTGSENTCGTLLVPSIHCTPKVGNESFPLPSSSPKITRIFSTVPNNNTPLRLLSHTANYSESLRYSSTVNHLSSISDRANISVHTSVPYSRTNNNRYSYSTTLYRVKKHNPPYTSRSTINHNHRYASVLPEQGSYTSLHSNTAIPSDLHSSSRESELYIHGKSYFRSNQLCTPIEPMSNSSTITHSKDGTGTSTPLRLLTNKPAFSNSVPNTGSRIYFDSSLSPRYTPHSKTFRLQSLLSSQSNTEDYHQRTNNLSVRGIETSKFSPIHSPSSPISNGTPIKSLQRRKSIRTHSPSMQERITEHIPRSYSYSFTNGISSSSSSTQRTGKTAPYDTNINNDPLFAHGIPPSIVRIPKPYVVKNFKIEPSSDSLSRSADKAIIGSSGYDSRTEESIDLEDDYDGFADYLIDQSILTRYDYNSSLDEGIRIEIIPNYNISFGTVSNGTHDSIPFSPTDYSSTVHGHSFASIDNSFDNEPDDRSSEVLSYRTGEEHESNRTIERKPDSDNILSSRSNGDHTSTGSMQYSYQSRSSLLSPTSILSPTSVKPYIPQLQFRLYGNENLSSSSSSHGNRTDNTQDLTTPNSTVPTLSTIPSFQDEFMMMVANGEMSDTWRAEAGLLPTVMHGV